MVLAFEEEPPAAEPYGVEFCGHCFGDWLPNGSTLMADPSQDIEPLSIVHVVMRCDGGPWDQFVDTFGGGAFGVTKYYLGSYEFFGETVYMLGQLAPPCVALIPECAIEAMHVAAPVEGASEMSRNDLAGLALIQAFCSGGTVPPLNPSWRVPWAS